MYVVPIAKGYSSRLWKRFWFSSFFSMKSYLLGSNHDLVDNQVDIWLSQQEQTFLKRMYMFCFKKGGTCYFSVKNKSTKVVTW